MGALGIGSTIGGLFGRKTGNPNEMLKDPNNPFYTIATQNYYKNLSKTLAANTPGKATLLALEAASGSGYGGSAYTAKKINENMLTKNRDTAASASEQFQNNLFTRGMELAAGGNMAQYQDANSFSDQLLTLGGGLFSRLFNQSGADYAFNNGVNESFDSYMQGVNKNQTDYLNNFKSTNLWNR